MTSLGEFYQHLPHELAESETVSDLQSMADVIGPEFLDLMLAEIFSPPIKELPE